jgi:glycerate kinase
MNILIAPDKFKGTLTALEAAQTIAEGFAQGIPGARCRLLPIADGGEGTAEILFRALDGIWREVECHDPLLRPVRAKFVWVPQNEMAIIETCAASGLVHVAPAERDPWRSSTYGAGELLAAALALHPRKIFVGLGGSATNDAGIGMASALGWRFSPLKKSAKSLVPSDFRGIAAIRPPEGSPPLPEIVAACDVSNPLLGPQGASSVYGPQKGADSETVLQLDAALRHMAELVRIQLGIDHSETPGAGAAGGLGYGLLTFCQAHLRSGFDLIAEIVGLEAAIAGADLVITGEGCLDDQTACGKGPVGVSALARQWDKPVWALAGRIKATAGSLFDWSLAAAADGVSDEQAFREARPRLREASRLAGIRWARESGR